MIAHSMMKSRPRRRQVHGRRVLVVGLAALALAGAAFGQAGSPGDQLTAEGRFAEAGAAYEKALSAAPNDPAALAGLARIRLFDGQDAKAAALAQQALAASPQDPVAAQTLRVAQLRLAAFGGEQYRIEAPAGETSIPFVQTDPLPVVQVTLGKSRQALFLIDTGAPDIMVSPELAQELGLPLTDGGQGVFAGGQRAQVQRTRVPELHLGAVTLSNVPAGVRPTGGFLSGKIEGIIGTGLLRHFLASLDYCGGQLVLAPRNASSAFQQRARDAHANIVPMWFAGDHFMFARGRLNQGHETLFLVDTGLSGGGLTANKATLDDAGVTIDETNVRSGVGGGGAVSFVPFRADATMGALSVKDVQGVYMAQQPPLPFPFPQGGILSHAFFRHSRLTFDFDAMRIVTEACPG